MLYFGGIEGGATHSTLAVIDGTGHVVVRSTGAKTNHWLMGMEACAEVIAGMVGAACETIRTNLGLDSAPHLETLSLCLAGMERDNEKDELESMLRKLDSGRVGRYLITNDAFGALAAASATGGVIVISGTGSNCFWKVDGTEESRVYRCGGWGHAVSDDGGSYDTARRAIRLIFRAAEKFPSDLKFTYEDVIPLEKAMFSYFNITRREDILHHLYRDFSKSNIAGFTKHVADLAGTGDKVALYLFEKAGQLLGRMVVGALSHRESGDLGNGKRLQIACVGSVFKSFKFMKESFSNQVSSVVDDSGNPLHFTVSFVARDSVCGAALLGAQFLGHDVPIDRSLLVDLLYEC